jgi:hypothetical protein
MRMASRLAQPPRRDRRCRERLGCLRAGRWRHHSPWSSEAACVVVGDRASLCWLVGGALGTVSVAPHALQPKISMFTTRHANAISWSGLQIGQTGAGLDGFPSRRRSLTAPPWGRGVAAPAFPPAEPGRPSSAVS